MATANRIKVIAISNPETRDIRMDITSKAKTFRTQGLTKASIEERLSADANKQVKISQLYELLDDEEMCSIDDNILPGIPNGEMIYALIQDAKVEVYRKISECGLREEHILANRLSAAVYRARPADEEGLECFDSIHLSAPEHGPAGWMIANAGKTRYVVFRGTVSVDDWKTNLDFALTQQDCGGFLHAGFAKCSSFFPRDVIASWLRSHGGDKTCDKVVVAGHSLGGALATIVTLRSLMTLRSDEIEKGKLTCVTFGAPLCVSQQVRDFLDKNRWNKFIENFVHTDDIVPQLLNAHPEKVVYNAASKAATAVGGQALAKAGEFLESAIANFVRHSGAPPEYAPVGRYYFLLEPQDAESKSDEDLVLITANPKEVAQRLGYPQLRGEWWVQGVQKHDINQYLLAVNRVWNRTSTFSPMEVMQAAWHKVKHGAGYVRDQAPSFRPGMCIGRMKQKELKPGMNYELKDQENGDWILILIKEDAGDGSFCGKALDGSDREISGITASQVRSLKPEALQFTFLVSTVTQDSGTTVPKHVQLTADVIERSHIAFSWTWLHKLTVLGLELEDEKLFVGPRDATGQVQIFFSADVKSGTLSDLPVEVEATHLFSRKKITFTEVGTAGEKEYTLCKDSVNGVATPLENILDCQSSSLLLKLLHRLMFEAFLGDVGKLPQAERSARLSDMKAFRLLTTLEELAAPQDRNIETFVSDRLMQFCQGDEKSCSDLMKSFIYESNEKLSKAFKNIEKFLFCPQKLNFPSSLTKQVAGGLGTVLALGGTVVCLGALAPVVYYGGFAAAATAAQVTGFSYAVGSGAVGAASGQTLRWLSAADEISAANYKEVLCSFIQEIGGQKGRVRHTCLDYENAIYKVMLDSEPLKSDAAIREKFERQDFASGCGMTPDDCLTPASLKSVWKGEEGQLCIKNATDKSIEMATRHLMATQTMWGIRRELLDTVWIAVLGMQNCGKSSFIKALWPTCDVVGLGGGKTHTVVPKPFRVNDNVVVVDFPGVNDWAHVEWMSSSFMHLASFVVVVLKCEDIAEDARQFLDDVRTRFSPEQIIVLANHADRYPELTRDKEAVEELCQVYAGEDRLNLKDPSTIALSAMKAFDGDGAVNQQSSAKLKAKGVKDPDEARKFLEKHLQRLLMKNVSLKSAETSINPDMGN